jgi:predicted DNA-binding antitoxin AbrB/MazE fold protein
MTLEIEATYENGVFKLDHPLPLNEHDRVRITVRPAISRMRRAAGSMRWSGDPEVLRHIAEDDELNGLDAP